MTTAQPPRRMPAPAPSPPPRRQAAAPPPSGPTIDPFKVIRRHLLLIMASIVVGGAVGTAAHFAFAKWMPLYTAQHIFKVQAGIATADEVSSQAAVRQDEVEIIAETELQWILSEEVLRRALAGADVRNTDWWKKNEDYAVGNKVDLAVEELMDEISSGVIRGSQLFSIEWSDRYRKSVPVVLNAIGAAYKTAADERDRDTYDKDLAEFEDQERNTLDQMEDLQSRIQQFIQDRGIVTLDDPRYNEVMSAMSDIVKTIADTQTALSSAISGFENTSRKLDGVLEYSDDDVREAENDQSVAPRISQVESIRAALDAARSKYTSPQHREVIELENELGAAQRVLDARRQEVIQRNLRARMKLLDSERGRLSAIIESLEADLADKQAQQKELTTQFARYREMEREMDSLYEQRRADMQLVRDLQLIRKRENRRRTATFQIATEPREKSFPELLIMLPLGVVLVSGLTVGLVFLRELTDRRVRTSADLEVLPNGEVLGVVPEISEDPTRCKAAELAIHDAPDSVMAESYRQVMNPLLKTVSLFDMRTVLFTSGMPKAGTTTVVGNVAASVAAAGRRVCIVDANFRRPRVATMMGGDDAAPGIGDVLMDRATIDEVVHDHESGVAWISAGSPECRIVERLGTVHLERAINQLSETFDLILFDVAPAVVAGDALAVAGRVDGAVLVVRAGEEERGLVRRVAGQLSSASRLVGIVLNRPRGTAGGYFRKNFAAMASYAKKG